MLPDASAATVPATAQEAYTAFSALVSANNCAALLDFYATPTVADKLETLNDGARGTVDISGAYCAERAQKYELALAFVRSGMLLRGVSPRFAFMKADVEDRMGKPADMASTLETLARENPDALAQVDLRWLGRAWTHAKKTSPEVARRLVAVFGTPGFHSAEPGASTDGYRYAYAVNEVAAGHVEAARTIFAAITSPSLLMQSTLDRRLRAIAPTGFDAHDAVERRMALAGEVAAAHPDDLSAAMALASNYELLDKGPEMLAILLPLRPGKTHPAIGVQKNYVQGWWALAATAYRLTGDYDATMAIMRESMNPGEVNEGDIGEWINIASVQLMFGRAAAALETLKNLEPQDAKLNGRGRTLRSVYRGCAKWIGGDPAAAETDLAYVREHDADAPGATVHLEMCMHHDDAVAAAAIKDLADPEQAADVLLIYSTFAPLPAAYPRGWDREGIDRLKRRPDVQAAVAKAGGAGTFDIPPL